MPSWKIYTSSLFAAWRFEIQLGELFLWLIRGQVGHRNNLMLCLVLYWLRHCYSTAISALPGPGWSGSPLQPKNAASFRYLTGNTVTTPVM